jgi:hypothetical protein
MKPVTIFEIHSLQTQSQCDNTNALICCLKIVDSVAIITKTELTNPSKYEAHLNNSKRIAYYL